MLFIYASAISSSKTALIGIGGLAVGLVIGALGTLFVKKKKNAAE